MLGGIICALAGGLIAYGNYSLTKRAALSGSRNLTALSVLRLLISAGYLTAVYFLAPLTPWSRIPMLVGAVVGLTVPMFILTARLIGKLDREKKEQEQGKGGDEDGGAV